jgi:hypothetical protein
VAAAAHGDRETMAPCEANRSDYIGGAGTLHDDGWAPILIFAVPDLTRLGVTVVTWRDHLSAD